MRVLVTGGAGFIGSHVVTALRSAGTTCWRSTCSAPERGEHVRVFEDGGQRRDFVHVTDVARANVAALAAVSTRDFRDLRAYNVASGEPGPFRGEAGDPVHDLLAGAYSVQAAAVAA